MLTSKQKTLPPALKKKIIAAKMKKKKNKKKKYWPNYVLEVKPLQSENLRCTHQRMLICMLVEFVVVKLHQAVKRKKRKKDNGQKRIKKLGFRKMG